MIFEEENQWNQQASQTNDDTDKQQNIQQIIYQEDSQNQFTIYFKHIAKLFQKISQTRGQKKSRILKDFLRKLFQKCRKSSFVYSILRLINPQEDSKQRGNYGMKQKAMAKILYKTFQLSRDDYQRLFHYKNPSYHSIGKSLGDFSICMYDVIKPYFRPNSTMTVKRLNQILTNLTNTIDQQRCFRDFFNQSNAEQMKWIARIILKDLKLGIRFENVLNTYHPDANQYYNTCNSLRQTCIKFENPIVSLSNQIQLFFSIRPMLAGKKIIQYFKQQTRTFYIQTKYDGQRVQAHFTKQQIKIFSRNGMPLQNIYQSILTTLSNSIKVDACILDGEAIIVQKSTGKMLPFGANKITALNRQNQNYSLCYKVFDIMWLQVQSQVMNLMGYPLRERKKILPKVLQEIPNQIEIVKFRQILDYNEILRQFNASLERNQEGVMLKDPNSAYVPKQRGINWLKLKGDYVNGVSQTMDLIIIGGYYGQNSFRLGQKGSHFTNNITSYLVAVLQYNQQKEQQRLPYAIPFARVGMGFSGEDLQQIRNRLKPNFVINSKNNRPNYIRCPWKITPNVNPDCWIDDIKTSILLQVIAAQIQDSTHYPTDCTLRFGRSIKIRYDKCWQQGMTVKQLQQFRDQMAYTKTMKKKDQEQSSDQQKQKQFIGRKRREPTKRKNQKVRNQVLHDMTIVDVSTQQLQSHLFAGQEYCVMPMPIDEKFTTHDLQKMILLNGGKISKNPISATKFIITATPNFQLKIYQNSERKYIFIKPKYIVNCIAAQKIIPLSPLYLTALPSHNSNFYREHFDKFGDSYTANLDIGELDQILSHMGQGYPIHQKLIQAISLPSSRSNKISFCVEIRLLNIIKLKSKGNKIVDKLDSRVNSIIKSKFSELSQDIRQQIKMHFSNDIQIQNIQDLIQND